MDISAELAVECLTRWKNAACPLSVAVRFEGLTVFSPARVKAVSAHLLFLAFSETGGLTVTLSRAIRYQSFLPEEALPPDIGGSHKGCRLFLVISLADKVVCKICELSDQTQFPVVMFSKTDETAN